MLYSVFLLLLCVNLFILICYFNFVIYFFHAIKKPCFKSLCLFFFCYSINKIFIHFNYLNVLIYLNRFKHNCTFGILKKQQFTNPRRWSQVSQGSCISKQVNWRTLNLTLFITPFFCRSVDFYCFHLG